MSALPDKQSRGDTKTIRHVIHETFIVKHDDASHNKVSVFLRKTRARVRINKFTKSRGNK